jgi:hypothetical protein
MIMPARRRPRLVTVLCTVATGTVTSRVAVTVTCQCAVCHWQPEAAVPLH